MKKFWNFQEKNKDGPVELRIDGDIIDDDDIWIYEWLGIVCTTPNAFRQELAQFEGRDISVWIDSYGGSVFAAVSIFNALMKCKNSGAKVITNVDGKAMSAASTIFMAGDERNMAPGSVLMLHNPLMGLDAGYASDFRKYADVLDTIKKGIMNAYQLATGLDTKIISKMMDDETYMDAQTAVSNKFATAVLFMGETPTPAMAMNFSRLPVLNAAGASMKEFAKIIQQQTKQKHQKTVQEEENMDIKNVQELKEAFPEMTAQLETEAIATERARVNALDAMDDVKNEAIHKIVAKAKETGKTAADVQEYVDIVKAVPVQTVETKPQNTTGLFNTMLADNKVSGSDGVKADGIPGNGVAAMAADAAMIKNFAELLKKK